MMIMQKGYLLVIVIVVFGVTGYFLSKQHKSFDESVQTETQMKIAVCPTFYDWIVSDDMVKVIKTVSTSQSLTLLKNHEVDYVLAGRILKPEEPNYSYRILGEGYSFLASKESKITENELQYKEIFTDLEKEEIETVFKLSKIQEVENVYEHLDQGIVITSWDNTDYTKAEIVHLLDENGERNINSRIPILYCYNECNEEIITLVKKGD